MTDAGSDGLNAAIQAIWVKHRDLMFQRMAAIEHAIDAETRAQLDPADRATAHRDAHKLAGALGTFGLHEGTTHARVLEHAFGGEGQLNVEDLIVAARGLRAQLESRS